MSLRLLATSAGFANRVQLRALAKLLVTVVVMSFPLAQDGRSDTHPIGDSARPPNLLFILADDLGVNDVGFTQSSGSQRREGAKRSFTPFLDELANSGIRFDRFYSDSSCAATRAGLLTGQPPARLGFRPAGDGLASEIETLPELLRNAGYRTVHIGKWHVGFRDQSAWPNQQGYDEFFGFFNQFLLQTPDGQKTLGRPSYLNPWLQRDNGSREKYLGHLSKILVEHATDNLRTLADRPTPWFMSFWGYAPHAPLEPLYTQSENSEPAKRYQQMLKTLDWQVERLVTTLQETGQLDRTIILFASDNGGTARHYASNHPLPGGKLFYYEGGVRVPMFVAGNISRPGRVRKDVASYLDVLPTLAGMARARVPKAVEGRDLFARDGNDDRVSPKALFWSQNNRSWSALSGDGRYRLVVDTLHPAGTLHSALANGPLKELNLPEQRELLTDRYNAWAAIQRDVQLADRKNHDGLRTLTLNNFQRAPGFGAHTMAICLTRNQSSVAARREVVASQGALWSLEKVDNAWAWEVNGTKLVSAASPDSSGELVLASSFAPSIAYPSRRSASMRMFWNGRLIAETEQQDFSSERVDLEEPTVLGSTKDGRWPFKGRIGNLQIWNEA
ncbi:MAG: sulfatase-like hydrolase/transferase, partial [Pseudomonadota bacterium]